MPESLEYKMEVKSSLPRLCTQIVCVFACELVSVCVRVCVCEYVFVGV